LLPPPPDRYQYARPSSLHTGVVIVSFCDGHQMELSDQIDPATLRHLMVPNDARVNADFALPGYTGDPNYVE
jgi:prepilin-type processing-associated H-X9-DG protein